MRTEPAERKLLLSVPEAAELLAWMSTLDSDVAARRNQRQDDTDDDAVLQVGPSRYVRIARDQSTGASLFAFDGGRGRTSYLTRDANGRRQAYNDWETAGGSGTWTDEVGRPFRPTIGKAAAPVFPPSIELNGRRYSLFGTSDNDTCAL